VIFGENFANFFCITKLKKSTCSQRVPSTIGSLYDFEHNFDVNGYGFNHTFCVSVNENLKLIYTPCKCKTSYPHMCN